MESTVVQRMLIVDDDPAVLATLTRGLLAFGIAADAFEHTSEALLHLESDRYVAVIADQVLPGALCGHEFLLAAQQVDPQALTILMSGKESIGIHRATDHFDATVHKPVTAAELVELVRMIQDLWTTEVAAA